MPTLAIDSLPDDEAIARAENRSIRAFRAHRARYPQRALDALDEYSRILTRAASNPDLLPVALVQIIMAAVKVIEQQRILLRIPGPPKDVPEKRASTIPSIMDVMDSPSIPEKVSQVANSELASQSENVPLSS